MLKIFVPLLLFCAVIISAQVPAQIEKGSFDILISFHKKSLPASEIEAMNKVLNSGIDYDIEDKYYVTKASYDSLKNHFIIFQNEVKNISLDSSLVLFNKWYLHFSNVFYKFRKVNFFTSNNKKIIFFSTSMSCYCTLEMCKKQLIDILKLLSQKRGGCPCSGRQINTDQYDLLVVDAYENNELQLKYETFFSPSVIVLDGNNKVLYKIEYEENMIDKLKNNLIGEI